MATDLNKKPQESKLLFAKENYYIILGGILVMVLGYIVMGSETEQYGFGFRGLTLGPALVMAGIVIEFFAIFFKPKPKA